jgi:hypothetical protein
MRQTCKVCEPGRHLPLEGNHLRFRDMPEHFRGLPAIAFVRNPWDWYVSW